MQGRSVTPGDTAPWIEISRTSFRPDGVAGIGYIRSVSDHGRQVRQIDHTLTVGSLTEPGQIATETSQNHGVRMNPVKRPQKAIATGSTPTISIVKR